MYNIFINNYKDFFLLHVFSFDGKIHKMEHLYKHDLQNVY